MHITNLKINDFIRVKPYSHTDLIYRRLKGNVYELVSSEPKKKAEKWILGYIEGFVLENDPKNGIVTITVSRQQKKQIVRALISYSHIEFAQLGVIKEVIIQTPLHKKGITLPPRVFFDKIKM